MHTRKRRWMSQLNGSLQDHFLRRRETDPSPFDGVPRAPVGATL